MTVHIVTGSNAGYMEKMRPYLETLKARAGAARCWLGCVDCDAPAWLPDSVTAVRIPREALAGSPGETESLQHGGWLPYLPIDAADTVIFTDGDIFMQREFSPDEWAALENWPAQAMGVSYNAGPTQTLLHEALFKLRPKVRPGDFLEHWGLNTLNGACFNVGVMVGKRATFDKLYTLYNERWDEIGQCLAHPARQQWLIGFILIDRGFDIHILPYTFHTHAHFALPDGTLVGRAGEAYFDNQLILFWHVPMWARRHV